MLGVTLTALSAVGVGCASAPVPPKAATATVRQDMSLGSGDGLGRRIYATHQADNADTLSDAR